ncbi:MAG: NAD(P)H-hydrate dehydratase [Paludibacteraceae bacterium]|nr:NAD(P)H-hydrate dehydratase [Paludibacteraceae bacterium]
MNEITFDIAKSLYKARPTDAHKGTFGRALLYAGSKGMMGAAVLSSKACLRSGVGLCYVLGPDCGLDIMQISVPEAIYKTEVPDPNLYSAVGCGPGLGKNEETSRYLRFMLKHTLVPMLLDADALNIIAEQKWQNLIPENAILTPHPMEFTRLTGFTGGREDMIAEACRFAREHKVIVVLKGAGTAVIDTDGTVFINTTGNSGMATAGSGDVLSGIITGLLAQGYKPYDAARLGVFLHGLAGDFAAKELSEEAMIASDIINFISKGYLIFQLQP